MNQVLTDFIEAWLKENPPPKQKATSGQAQTIAELVQQNFYQLLTDGKITSDNLKAIAAGGKPSNSDLVRIARILEIREEDLLAMRDRVQNPKGRLSDLRRGRNIADNSSI
jgi:hypothetical protein